METIEIGKLSPIITGVAGTGKSAILSNYYEQLKEKNPTDWVVKLDLLDHSKSIEEFIDSIAKTAFDFFVDLPTVVGHSLFARSLLRHRLETGDRIVILLDGFDEIDNNCQKKATELILFIIKKPIQLYVTTRTHLIDELQDKLFQFVTFGLKPFTKSNQINYLTSFWENDLKIHVERKKIVSDSLREFADKLVDKISESLNDREREFVGIPLQCKMLAENFQSAINDYIKESLKNSSEDKIQLEKLINDNTKFDLTSLYESFMEKI